MNVNSVTALSALYAAVSQARLESVGMRRDPRAAVVAATQTPPTPAPAAREAESLGEQARLALESEQRALARLQASLKSLPRHDPVLGTLLDVSA